MNGVPRFRATGSGRWHVEKRRNGWAAISPQGHVIRQPSHAAAYGYALGRIHEAKIIANANQIIIRVDGTVKPDVVKRQIERLLGMSRGFDAIGGY